MLYRAEICTPWGQDSEGSNIPQVVLDYCYTAEGIAMPHKATDVTDNTADVQPNLLCILLEADESIISQIEADSNYQVLWSEPL